jgi:hypothetical protein
MFHLVRLLSIRRPDKHHGIYKRREFQYCPGVLLMQD